MMEKEIKVVVSFTLRTDGRTTEDALDILSGELDSMADTVDDYTDDIIVEFDGIYVKR